MRMKKKRKNMIDVVVISVPLCSEVRSMFHNVMFLEEDRKKRISISHLLKGN